MQEHIIFALIGICFILMVFLPITDSISKKRRCLLFFMTLATMLLIVSSWLSALYNGDTSTAGVYITRISRFFKYGMNPLIIYVFGLYLENFLTVEGGLEKRPNGLKIANYILTTGGFMLFLSQFTGFYYYFDENNIYHRASWNFVSYIFPIAAIVVLLVTLIQHRQNLKKRLLLPLLLFTIMPPISSIFYLFSKGTSSLTYIFIVGMMVLLYCFSILDANKVIKTAHQKEVDLVRQTTLALVEAIDAKDSYTNGHSRRVADFSVAIAEKAGKNKEECEKIHLIALLHDVGKIGIPDAIINKEGKLTDEEYAIIKTHPRVGREILSKISASPELAIGASFHHERYDGKGYPFGLKGEEIPEMARIIAIADTYDAMASKRSYRDVLPESKIKSEIERGIGTQFDPQFAKIMLELINSGEIYQLENSADS